MPYVTDGSVHHIGVRNEHALAERFNASTPQVLQDAYPGKLLRFVQRGGTHQVDDVEVTCDGARVTGISTKHHGGNGTFDYINTSKITDYLPAAAGLVRQLAELRAAHLRVADALPAVRAHVNAGISGLWGSLTGENVRALLQSIHRRNSEWVAIVTSGAIHTVHHTRFEELAVHPYDPETQYELRNTRAASSRQIWRTKNGMSVNTHLRVRIALNNGVGALIGLSASNANSILTLKIQQDNVGGLIKTLLASSA
jgi:hypothetical protein